MQGKIKNRVVVRIPYMVLTNKRIEAPNKRIEAPNKRIAAPKESQFTGAISNAKYFKCHKQFVVCQRNLSWSS
ncbi:hypothetical protein AC249_AIPGENE23389 [Exaiptasia diaphana]|nr:hypothetical protein AC249_AIPGENE23389 [Exaiptasia diaphana]